MNPQQSLQLQDKIRRLYALALRTRHKDTGDAPAQSERSILCALETGANYIIREDILKNLVVPAGASLQHDTKLAPDMFPSKCGCVLFDAPIYVRLNGFDTGISGLVWNTLVLAVPTEHNEPYPQHALADAAPGVLVCAMMDTSQTAAARICAVDPQYFATWRFDNNLGEALYKATYYSTTKDEDPDGLTTEICYRTLAALLLFMQQHVLTTPRVQADKHTRRDLIKWQSKLPLMINVVTIRHAEVRGYAAHAGEAAHDHIEWSCRWLVRGHWRNQPYGSGRKQVRKVWITPYLKGPDGKPLREKPTVFSVSR